MKQLRTSPNEKNDAEREGGLNYVQGFEEMDRSNYGAVNEREERRQGWCKDTKASRVCVYWHDDPT